MRFAMRPDLSKSPKPPTSKQLTQLQASKLARILEATKQLLATRSAEQLTMRDIAVASDVAEGTLYNRFGTKDGLIATVLLDYFDQAIGSLIAHRKSAMPADTFAYGLGVIARAVVAASNFARALMSTYFRVSAEHLPADHLAQRVFDTWLPVLEEMRHRQLLAEWVSIELLNVEICDRLFAVVVKWAQGKIPDRELRNQLHFAIFMILLGVSTGAQADAVRAMLEHLNNKLGPRQDRWVGYSRTVRNR